MNALKHTFATAKSASLSVMLAVILTLWSEFSTSFKDMLTNISGHHWTTKSYCVVIAFLILWWLFARDKNISEQKAAHAVTQLLWVTALGVVVIIGFYWWHSL